MAETLTVDPLRLCSVKAVRRLLKEHRLRPSKAMGQSFVVNRFALVKILEAAALQPDDGALEIGTGLGTLTAALATRCRQVVTLEKDRRLFATARSLLVSFANVAPHHADGLKADWSSLLLRHPEVRRWKFVSNLPYAVSKPLLMRLMDERKLFSDATVTVQREVAQRMAAQPGAEGYSILTVAVQLYADVEVAATLPPKDFYPEPEVWSSVVKMRFLQKPRVAVSDERFFFRVAEAVLMQRRKMVVNALSNRLGIPKEKTQVVLRGCGIDPKRRGETLTLEELAGLAAALTTRL